MALPSLQGLVSLPAPEVPHLLAAPVAEALRRWPCADRLAVVEIDPELADTAALTAAYGVPLAASANCVVVAGSRAGQEQVAACVLPADKRADVNGMVRRRLDVRKASFLPRRRAVSETAMEYGAITPVGLPAGWRVLMDASVPTLHVAVIGSGVRRSKLLLSGADLARLPSVELVEGLGR